MKALVYTGPLTSEVQSLPIPEPAAGQAIVDLSHCGICGSDMHAWHGHDDRRIPPMVLGHEGAGVARTGKYAGKPVVINPLIPCKTCSLCQSGYENLCLNREMVGMQLQGAFAEIIAVPEDNLVPVHADLSLDIAALAEPLACSVNAVRLATDRISDKSAGIVILGGGAIGLLAALVFQHYGYSDIWIAETNSHRRKLLEGLGNFRAYDPINQHPGLSSVDIVFDAVGSGITRASSSAMVRPGGVIVHIGLQDNAEGLDTRRITLQQISFLGAYCYRQSEFEEAVTLLEKGVITGAGWSEIRSLEEGPKAFTDIHNGAAPPKIILATHS